MVTIEVDFRSLHTSSIAATRLRGSVAGWRTIGIVCAEDEGVVKFMTPRAKDDSNESTVTQISGTLCQTLMLLCCPRS